MQDDEAREELKAHLDMQVEQLEAMGWSREDAVREARLRFGNVRATLEAIETRPSRLRIALEESRGSLRALLRRRAFLAATVVPLALAMTLAVTTFGVVDTILVKPLPYADSARIVRVGERLAAGEVPVWSNRLVGAPMIDAWERGTKTMARLAVHRNVFRTLAVEDERTRILTAAVGVGFFDVFQLPPFAGRYFQPADTASAADRPVAVVSHAFWQRTLNGDPAAVGRSIVLDDAPTLVIGIAPAGLRFPGRNTPIWTLMRDNDPATAGPLNAIGRLRSDATAESAAAEATVVARREPSSLHADDGADAEPVRIDVVALADDYAAPVRRGLLLFAGAALAVLLAATLHVGHLFVVYAQERRRDFAVRAALGAAPWRLVVMAVTTVAGVCGLAGACTALLAAGTHAALPALLPADFPRLHEIAFTLRSAAVIAGAMLVTTLGGAAIVVRHLARQPVAEPAAVLGAGGLRTSASVRGRAALAILVGEVAFSAALLIVAGLLARSFIGLATTDPGYAPDGALTTQVSFPPAMAQIERRQLVERIVTTLSQRPDVTAAGASNTLPLEDVKVIFVFDGDTDAGAAEQQRVRGDFGLVSPGYLEALGARIVEGRGFTWDDTASGRPVAVVNRAFMRRYFPDRDAIDFNVPGSSQTVVGVVDDVRLEGPTAEAAPAFYASMMQREQATFFHRVNLVVRTTGDPLALAGVVRDVVRATDDRLALSDISTLDRELSAAVARPRLYATMLVTCAVLSLAIVAIGLFASLAYAAARRRREVAIRMAIGAQRTSVAFLLARDSVVVTGLGLLIGTAAGLAVGRTLASLLHGISSADPLVIAMTTAALGVAAAAAAAVPIANAVRTDLARELRSQ